MSDKAITQESYQATAEEYARNVAELAPLHSIERFIKMLPDAAKILDIGCGSGRDAKIFTERGVSVLGIDFCSNLIDIAKVYAPLAEFQVVDIEEADFPTGSFDGVWACCSLSQIPKKRLPAVLRKVHSWLKEGGYFYLAVRKGLGEGLEKDSRYEGDFKKFWAFFEEDEMKGFVESAKFQVLECCATIIKKAAYPTPLCVRVFCKKETT